MDPLTRFGCAYVKSRGVQPSSGEPVKLSSWTAPRHSGLIKVKAPVADSESSPDRSFAFPSAPRVRDTKGRPLPASNDSPPRAA